MRLKSLELCGRVGVALCRQPDCKNRLHRVSELGLKQLELYWDSAK